ncbi:uncharacterized protein LOC129695230 [Leucoraja erinacea]|uniref:uncharacterized protein LOC129695230 n=1 Tax=Leucoraja erinaceus TaxID=7782 RepID=UPI0024589351|nr:uncharacterized protein LOC129695230 [Leucoraja erinacea]
MKWWRRDWAWMWAVAGMLATPCVLATPWYTSQPPAAAAEGKENEDGQKWEYVTRASEHVEEGLDTRQDLLKANSHFEQMRKTAKFRFVLPNINMNQPVGSSVLLSVNPNRLRRKVVWKFRNHERELTILEHVSYSNMVSFNSYFRYRADYDLLTGSLLVTKLELTDGGLYEVILSELTDDKTITSKNVYYYLKVQELLSTPRIYQKPNYIMDSVQLICFMRDIQNIYTEWAKDGVSLVNNSHFEVSNDGSMLLIKELRVSDCGSYMCRVHNDVSANFASLFLSADGKISLRMWNNSGSSYFGF